MQGRALSIFLILIILIVFLVSLLICVPTHVHFNLRRSFCQVAPGGSLYPPE